MHEGRSPVAIADANAFTIITFCTPARNRKLRLLVQQSIGFWPDHVNYVIGHRSGYVGLAWLDGV